VISYRGFFAEPTGYGNAARLHARALLEAGDVVDVIPVALTHEGPCTLRIPRSLRGGIPRERVRRSSRASIGVVHVPPHHFELVRDTAVASVAAVAWELTALPRGWVEALAGAQRIWVPSAFCAESFAAVRAPIDVIPHPIWAPPDIPRRAFLRRVPDEIYLFVAVLEWSDRKNPIGLLRAFRASFGDRRDVGLLLKVSGRFGADMDRTITRIALEMLGARCPVFTVVGDADDDTMAAIYARADAFVSLHRAEGFGLCMAEAMACARPVVATRFSANLEIMDDRSAFLVDCDLIPAKQSLTYYAPFDDPRMEWAEPHLDAAVDALRTCVEAPSEAAARGRAGRENVLAKLSPASVATRMRASLSQVAPSAVAR
jgi:glycosyltransferase involved in cell wall biosynthesis